MSTTLIFPSNPPAATSNLSRSAFIHFHALGLSSSETHIHVCVELVLFCECLDWFRNIRFHYVKKPGSKKRSCTRYDYIRLKIRPKLIGFFSGLKLTNFSLHLFAHMSDPSKKNPACCRHHTCSLVFFLIKSLPFQIGVAWYLNLKVPWTSITRQIIGDLSGGSPLRWCDYSLMIGASKLRFVRW